jgi:hypothetical protein
MAAGKVIDGTAFYDSIAFKGRDRRPLPDLAL